MNTTVVLSVHKDQQDFVSHMVGEGAVLTLAVIKVPGTNFSVLLMVAGNAALQEDVISQLLVVRAFAPAMEVAADARLKAVKNQHNHQLSFV